MNHGFQLSVFPFSHSPYPKNCNNYLTSLVASARNTLIYPIPETYKTPQDAWVSQENIFNFACVCHFPSMTFSLCSCVLCLLGNDAFSVSHEGTGQKYLTCGF